VRVHDGRLAALGLCQAGELVRHAVQAGVKAGHLKDLAAWTDEALRLAEAKKGSFYFSGNGTRKSRMPPFSSCSAGRGSISVNRPIGQSVHAGLA